MFWNKNKQVHAPVTEHDERVKCGECKHWIDKSDAQFVDVYPFYESTNELDCAYYCPMHKKPFDAIRWRYCPIPGKKAGERVVTKYFKTIPEHQVEVTEKGREIKRKRNLP